MPRVLYSWVCVHGCLIFLLGIFAFGQDASTGAIRGTVSDSMGSRIVDASIALVDEAQGFRYFVTSDSQGQFVFELLPPGEYSARAVAPDMSPQLAPKLRVDVGATTEIEFKLQVGGAKEMVTVAGEPPLVESQSNAVSSLVDKRAIEELPLDGRRFTDLALLTPGVTQDPRGLTSTRMVIWLLAESAGISPATWSTGRTTIMRSSRRHGEVIARPTSFPTKWWRSSGFRRIPTVRNWDAPEGR